MAEYTIGPAEIVAERISDFAEFINLATGRSIISGADWGPERFELGLSGEAMVRIFWTPSGLKVNLISTTNKGEIPPLILKIENKSQRIPAHVLEARLRGLRTLHAIVQLITTNRGELLSNTLLNDNKADVEMLLNDQEMLSIEAIAPGSWYITAWTALRSSYKSLLAVAAMVYCRGRDSMLRKIEAEARLKELDVEEREFKLLTKKVDYAIGLSRKLPTPEAKELVRIRVEEAVKDVLGTNATPNEIKKSTHLLMDDDSEKKII